MSVPLISLVEKLPNWQGRVLSSSMEPVICSGDTVIFQKVPLENIRRLDVVAYGDAKGRIVVHRVIRTYMQGDKRIFLLKGDNAQNVDPEFDGRQILGKATEVRNKYKRILLDGKGTIAWFWLAQIPIVNKLASRLARSHKVGKLVLSVFALFGRNGKI